MDLSTRLDNSWSAIKASSHVMAKEPMLFVFPVFSVIVTLGTFVGLICIMFFDIFGLARDFGTYCFGFFAMFILAYLLSEISKVYSDVAIVGCARMRLEGKDPTVIDGFRIATTRIPSIILWGLVEATYGSFVSSLRAGPLRIGGMWAYRLKVSWYVDTIFVNSIIAEVNTGPMDALGRSRMLVTKKWGQNLAPNYNIWLTFMLIGIVIGAVIFVIWIISLFFGLAPLTLYFFLVFIVICVLLAFVSATVKCVFEAALFRYALTGDGGEWFPLDLCENAFEAIRGDMDWKKAGWTGDWQ
jgi:hypothetical protein